MADDTRHVIVEDETLAAGFTQIPNLVLRRSDLPPGAKLTYMALLSYAWDKDHAYPGQDRLAADMGVSERSVITYLKQLVDAGLITINRRGLGMTNVYILHSLVSGSEKSAPPEVQETTALEMQDLPAKKTQEKKTKREQVEISKDRNYDQYDEDREIIARYITDWARDFVDRAPIASSISRAHNLYRVSDLDLETFVARMYTARYIQVTLERSASVTTTPDAHGRKPRMPYWFSILEAMLAKESA